MEKGSFHPSAGAVALNTPTPSQPTRVQKIDEIVSRIPLPNEMPKGLDFTGSSIPKISSSTLDTLISQNEDLMARLSVSLRKTSFLDERSSALEMENASLKNRLSALEDKLLILQEKDRLNTGRNQSLHEEAQSSKATAMKLERLYADLYLQAQAFQRRVVALERYRARIKRASLKIKARARQVDILEQQINAIETSRTQFISSYESKLHEARVQVDEVRAKAQERDLIQQDKIRLENQLLFEQRQFKQSRQSSVAEIERLEKESASVRIQLKEALIRNESQRLELEHFKTEIPDLQEETKALREQVESLQALWGHRQREFNQLEEKNKNLQNLNQALSANLNVQRKEAQDLKNAMDRESYLKQEKIKALQTEIEMLRHQMKEMEASS